MEIVTNDGMRKLALVLCFLWKYAAHILSQGPLTDFVAFFFIPFSIPAKETSSGPLVLSRREYARLQHNATVRTQSALLRDREASERVCVCVCLCLCVSVCV